MQPDNPLEKNAPLWLLIDTNLLRRFVSQFDYGFHLRQLEKWVTEDYIKLIVTPQSIVEWQKHRVEVMKVLKDKQKEHADLVMAHLALQMPAPVSPDPSAADNLLQSQIDAIDRLLATPTTRESYSAVLEKVYQLHLHRQPPFHINEKSHNDAYMLFNAIHCMTENGISCFYFISSNTKEFADQNDKKTFHPELKKHYPNVEVHYYVDFDSCFADLKAKGLPPIEAPERVGTSTVTKFLINKDASMLDQVYDYFLQVFKEWNFLPQRFFTDHYPFIKGSKVSYYKRPFMLYTNNEEVLQLLSNVALTDGTFIFKNPALFPEDSSTAVKLKTVMTTLSFNYVYFLTKDSTGFNKHEIYWVADISGKDSPLGALLRFEYEKLFNLNVEDSDDATQILEKAYVQAKMGQFLESFNSYKAAAVKTFTKEPSLYYLANFCMNKLGKMLRGSYANEHLSIVAQTNQEASDINLEETLKLSNNDKNREILQALHGNQQLQRSGVVIQQAVSKLRDHFYSRNRGNTDQYHVLEFEFRQLEGFYVFNHNIFDEYGDFQVIAHDYIEGLLAAYGCNEDLSGKLGSFNKALLFSLVRYADRDILEKMLNRYDIRSIKLDDEKDGAIFINKFNDLLKNYGTIMAAYETQTTVKSYAFPDIIEVQLYNFLILAGRIEFDKELTDSIFDAIDVFLTNAPSHIKDFFFRKHLARFVNAKAKEASKEKLLRLLFFCLDSDQYNDVYLVANIVEQLQQKGKFPVEFTQAQFAKFKTRYLPAQPTPNHDNNFSVVEWLFGAIANQDYKAEITQYYTDQLTAKFNFRLFYGPSIFGIIPTNESFISQYHQQMRIYIDGYQKTGLVGVSRYNDLTIDKYLNYCFKEHVILPAEVKDSLSVLSPYYRWLLDMETFDYAKFDLRWLNVYYTAYYKGRFKSSEALKSHLLQHFKEQPKSPYQGTFIHIFHM